MSTSSQLQVRVQGCRIASTHPTCGFRPGLAMHPTCRVVLLTEERRLPTAAGCPPTEDGHPTLPANDYNRRGPRVHSTHLQQQLGRPITSKAEHKTFKQRKSPDDFSDHRALSSRSNIRCEKICRDEFLQFRIVQHVTRTTTRKKNRSTCATLTKNNNIRTRVTTTLTRPEGQRSRAY